MTYLKWDSLAPGVLKQAGQCLVKYGDGQPLQA